MSNKLTKLVKDMEKTAQAIDQSGLEIPLDSKCALHPAMDMFQGHLMYGIPNGKNPLFISNRRLVSSNEINQTNSLSTSSQVLKFSKEGIERYLNGEVVNSASLYSVLRDTLARHIVFPYDWQKDIIVAWILGTYLYRIFPLYPYLWIQSPTKRCGKTKLLEILSYLCFNSGGIETAPSEAPLFRVPAITGGTLLYDEAENIGKNKDKSELVSILNTAYRRDGVVARCEGKEHKVRFHRVFRPIVISGITKLPDTVADRSLRIELVRKKTDEKVDRLAFNSYGFFQELRDKLHVFALENAGLILNAYENFNGELIPNSCDDRLRDALEVLLSIISPIIKAGNDEPLHELTIAVEDLSGLRNLDEGDTVFIRSIETLKEYIEKMKSAQVVLSSKAASELLTESLEFEVTAKDAKRMLKRLGFYSGSHRQGSDVTRGYLIERGKIDGLFMRYVSNSP